MWKTYEWKILWKGNKDKIVFYSIHKPIKGIKIMYMTEISRDLKKTIEKL